VRDSPPPRSWFAVGSIHPATKGREAEIADLLNCAGKAEIVEDIQATKWMKLVSNATTLVSTGLLGMPMHDAVALPAMRELMLRSGEEALETGKALGHPVLPIFGMSAEDVRKSNRLVETLLDTLLAGFTLKHTTTTVLQDWKKGRHSEVNELNGHVAAQAARLGRAAPVNAAITELALRVERGEIKPDPSNLDLLLKMAG
jgi:2-dehydropantoate 2-reductase